MITYALTFGYTYGAETWARYGPKGFDTATPNRDASRAAQGMGFQHSYDEAEFVQDMLVPPLKCKRAECREVRNLKIEGYVGYLRGLNGTELLRHYDWANNVGYDIY